MYEEAQGCARTSICAMPGDGKASERGKRTRAEAVFEEHRFAGEFTLSSGERNATNTLELWRMVIRTLWFFPIHWLLAGLPHLENLYIHIVGESGDLLPLPTLAGL